MGVFGDRRVSLCRELTKLNEEIIRTTFSKALEYYKELAPRGEYVLVVEGCDKAQMQGDAFWKDMTIDEHLNYYISQEMKKMDAIKAVAKDRGVSKSEIYKEVNT